MYSQLFFESEVPRLIAANNEKVSSLTSLMTEHAEVQPIDFNNLPVVPLPVLNLAILTAISARRARGYEYEAKGKLHDHLVGVR